MAETRETLSGALDAAREGLKRAQERAQYAAERIARERRIEQSQRDAARALERRADLVGDMVELSRAAREAQTSSAVVRTANSISREVVNLGRRMDIRA